LLPARRVAGTVALGVLALLVAAGATAAPRLVGVSPGVRDLLFAVGVSSLLSVAGIAAVTCLARAHHRPRLDAPPRFARPATPQPPVGPPHPAGSASGGVGALGGIAVAARRFAESVLYVLWLSRHLALDLAVRAANTCEAAGREVAAALAWAAHETALIVVFSLRETRGAFRRAARPVLAGSLLACAGGVAAVCAAHMFAAYLRSGALDGAGLAAGSAAASVAAVVLVWWAFSDAALSEVLRAAGRGVGPLGARAFLLGLLCAWTEGLLGLLGLSSIRPGWLTAAGTAILVASLMLPRSSEAGA
jgi:hypothetical protein